MDEFENLRDKLENGVKKMSDKEKLKVQTKMNALISNNRHSGKKDDHEPTHDELVERLHTVINRSKLQHRTGSKQRTKIIDDLLAKEKEKNENKKKLMDDIKKQDELKKQEEIKKQEEKKKKKAEKKKRANKRKQPSVDGENKHIETQVNVENTIKIDDSPCKKDDLIKDFVN